MSGRIVSEEDRFAAYFRDRVLELDIPTPPREAMWAAIDARRSGGARSVSAANEPAPAVTPTLVLADGAVVAARQGGGSPSDKPNPKTVVPRRMVPLQWAMPIAAALLVVGTGIGYKLHQRPGQGALPASVAVAAEPFRPEVAADLVVGRHFAEAKQLLATFKSDQNESGAQQVAADAKVSEWARNMLSVTLVLSDSPMEMDPDRRKLLKDLADVLVQIANLSTLPDDPKLVEQSITRSQMMQRLQAKMPLGMEPRGI